jgi:hypothetical protein
MVTHYTTYQYESSGANTIRKSTTVLYGFHDLLCVHCCGAYLFCGKAQAVAKHFGSACVGGKGHSGQSPWQIAQSLLQRACNEGGLLYICHLIQGRSDGQQKTDEVCKAHPEGFERYFSERIE